MITVFFVAAFCVTALVLMTVAITRGIPRAVWVVGLCLSIGIIMLVVFLKTMDPWEGEGKEIPVTREYAASVRADGFPITVERAFEASSFGGFHGDGAGVTVYRYPPRESDALVSTLKQRERTFAWNDVPSKNFGFSSLRKLLPPDFLPAPDSWSLLVGSPAEGPPVQEFVVDRSKGILYVIRNQY